MGLFLEYHILRRLVTIPALFVGFGLLTLSLPVLMPAALLVDLFRHMAGGAPAMAARMLTFAWLYGLGECWAILAMAGVSLLGRRRSLELTFSLQRIWLDWNFEALRLAFNLRFAVSGSGVVAPGPILLVSRHASLIDTMLPGRFVVTPTGIRLRYVLKKELLVDPALDIGGNRLPNYFIDRSGDTTEEVSNIRRLASNLTADEGILIYPEGTRFSVEKRDRIVSKLVDQGDAMADIASRFRNVLPPRAAGTLALLEATEADVVFLIHRGLEGFASVADIWSGGLVGSTIDVAFWRVNRSAIPELADQRAKWLFEFWSKIDSWVTATDSIDGRHGNPL